MNIETPTSYIVRSTTSRGLQVVKTHWSPGYTPAHKATPDEAIEYAIRKKQRAIQVLKDEIETLTDMRKKTN